MLKLRKIQLKKRKREWIDIRTVNNTSLTSRAQLTRSLKKDPIKRKERLGPGERASKACENMCAFSCKDRSPKMVTTEYEDTGKISQNLKKDKTRFHKCLFKNMTL